MCLQSRQAKRIKNNQTCHEIYALNLKGFQNGIIGLKVTALFPDQENREFQSRHKYWSFWTILLCIVVELAGVGSAINGTNRLVYWRIRKNFQDVVFTTFQIK